MADNACFKARKDEAISRMHSCRRESHPSRIQEGKTVLTSDTAKGIAYT